MGACPAAGPDSLSQPPCRRRRAGQHRRRHPRAARGRASRRQVEGRPVGWT